MQAQSESHTEDRAVDYRTLHALCEQLRRQVTQVVPPVHVFDIPPQVMRGLFSVAWVTRGGTLHRCELPYLDPDAIAGERRLLAKLLQWGEVARTVGRIEVGANTGELLRYFLPDSVEQGRRGPRRPERCHVEWLSAGRLGAGPKRVWLVGETGGGKIGGISVAGAHLLVRLPADAAARLHSVCQQLGCSGIGEVPRDSPLFRDVMGEWQTR